MWIGQGIAFASLVLGAVYLEIHGKPVGGLWALIVLWAIATEWYPKNKGE